MKIDNAKVSPLGLIVWFIALGISVGWLHIAGVDENLAVIALIGVSDNGGTLKFEDPGQGFVLAIMLIWLSGMAMLVGSIVGLLN